METNINKRGHVQQLKKNRVKLNFEEGRPTDQVKRRWYEDRFVIIGIPFLFVSIVTISMALYKDILKNMNNRSLMGLLLLGPLGLLLAAALRVGKTADEGVQGNYLGMTAAEDWRQVDQATTVHIISTPYDKTNPIAGAKARATKDFNDNAAAGVYVFNPNSGLRAAAAAAGMSEEEQGAKWMQLWTEVCRKVQATGGKCFVMAKGTPQSPVLEGKAQQGEVNVAEMARVPVEYVFY